MSVECFLDTNVLVYALSAAPEDAAKKAAALELITGSDFGLSVQVLQEFYVVVTGKIRRTLSPEVAASLLEEYRLFPLALTDYPLVVSAIEISLRYDLAYWDGAIIAAAETLQAPVLFTEDLSHGQLYGSVRVLNPFWET